MTPLTGPVLTAAEMRLAELASGVPLGELMERAGAALAEAVWRFGGGAPTLILCGPGNNGGDGYVAARVLAERGVAVRVAASSAPASDLAQIAAGAWNGPVETLAAARPSPIIVDALFGTGMTRALEPSVRQNLHRLSNAARFAIAADLPSGIDSDAGADLGAAKADVTLAIGAAKPAHLLQPAADQCGTVMIANIGVDAASNCAVLLEPVLKGPTAGDHKYTRGLVLVVGGAMPGAAALSATASARSGAGYVILAGEGGSVPNAVVRRSVSDIDALLSDDRICAVLIGPGLGRGHESLIAQVLATPHSVVLDGDALRSVPAPRAAPVVLTPHAGEFARMFGDGAGSKIERARDAARRSGATVVFKGSDTVVASPDGRATLAPAASAWLSTAGTGDVFAGIVAAMLVRGMDAHDAACAAVWLHGDAARRAGPGFIADDLTQHIRLG